MRSRLGFVFRHEALVSPETLPDLSGCDLIVAKLNYKTPLEKVLALIKALSDRKNPSTRLVYFDGNDDICIQWPEVLDHVDLYVKRHAFRDRAAYLRTYIGGTNLTDYVHRHGYPCEGVSRPVDARYLDRIFTGVTFGLDENILSMVDEGKGLVRPDRERPFDVYFRGNIPENWMGPLRSAIAPALGNLGETHRVVCTEQGISREQYLEDLAGTKICISPLGYGEICYRDSESIILGCLLMKPDMGHLEARPDIYRAGETYVPVAWDYHDLREKITWYLDHPEERLRIVRRAQEVVRESCREEWFADRVKAMLQRVNPS